MIDPPAGVLVVTGTGTGVGKTVVTAAVATLAAAAGLRVAAVKAAQTGVGAGEPGDADQIRRLSGLARGQVYELARYPLPLAPATAARLSGLAPVDLDNCVAVVTELATNHHLVLVEGAGGLLVRLRDVPSTGATVAELAEQLGASVLVVVEPGLGTLNATALTLEALDRRRLRCAGLVLGRWPAEPDLACTANIGDLETIAGRRLAGALPDGMGTLSPERFRSAATAALGPELGGTFDAANFRREHAPRTLIDEQE